jgi:hypothetical protein
MKLDSSRQKIATHGLRRELEWPRQVPRARHLSSVKTGQDLILGEPGSAAARSVAETRSGKPALARENSTAVYCRDPETGRWVPMRSEADAASRLLAIWKGRFSRYALSDH